MKKWTCLLAILLCLSSAGDIEKATLVLYRSREFLGIGYDIKINDKFIANLSVNSFIEVKIKPGNHLIESSAYRGSKRSIRLQMESNQTYYLKAYEEVDFWDRYLVMQAVEENLAKNEMRKCRKNEKIKMPD